MAYKKLSPKQREQKKHNRLYPFDEKTPFWNLLTRRKQYYEEYVYWLEHMKQSGLLELPDDYDPRRITMFHFCFVVTKTSSHIILVKTVRIGSL